MLIAFQLAAILFVVSAMMSLCALAAKVIERYEWISTMRDEAAAQRSYNKRWSEALGAALIKEQEKRSGNT